jgi:hypothetical protein
MLAEVYMLRMETQLRQAALVPVTNDRRFVPIALPAQASSRAAANQPAGASRA